MRRIAALHTILLLAASAAACARNPEPRAGSDSLPADSAAAAEQSMQPQEERLTGRIVNSGTERLVITTLQVEGQGPTRLVGALESELRRLSGATVSVVGTVDSTGPPPGVSLDVREYELLSINGQRPLVGTVLVRDDGIWLAAADTVRLVPELQELRDHAGARVWVVGTASANGSELRVGSYGVIAPAPAP